MIVFFLFNDAATTEIYALSLHDALPICLGNHLLEQLQPFGCQFRRDLGEPRDIAAGARNARDNPGLNQDRKSTRLNSSHANISYAAFCLKTNNTQPCPTT